MDCEYYLSQQLHPVVSRLIDPLEGTDAARIAQCLGLDPEQYRRSAGADNRMSAEEEGAMREEDRFRQCEKLKVSCECGETATVDSAVRGISDTDRVLALARCADPKCERVPVVAGHAAIKNALTMAFRDVCSSVHCDFNSGNFSEKSFLNKSNAVGGPFGFNSGNRSTVHKAD